MLRLQLRSRMPIVSIFAMSNLRKVIGIQRSVTVPDVIVSNPPYIATDDVHLAQGDLRFEPRAALISGTDGLDAIRSIASAAPAHLKCGGWLLLEHGWEQGEAVRGVLVKSGFVEIFTAVDLEGRDRVSGARVV